MVFSSLAINPLSNKADNPCVPALAVNLVIDILNFCLVVCILAQIQGMKHQFFSVQLWALTVKLATHSK